MTIGIVLVACFAALIAGSPTANTTSTLSCDELGREFREAGGLPVGRSILERDVPRIPDEGLFDEVLIRDRRPARVEPTHPIRSLLRCHLDGRRRHRTRLAVSGGTFAGETGTADRGTSRASGASVGGVVGGGSDADRAAVGIAEDTITGAGGLDRRFNAGRRRPRTRRRARDPLRGDRPCSARGAVARTAGDRDSSNTHIPITTSEATATPTPPPITAGRFHARVAATFDLPPELIENLVHPGPELRILLERLHDDALRRSGYGATAADRQVAARSAASR